LLALLLKLPPLAVVVLWVLCIDVKTHQAEKTAGGRALASGSSASGAVGVPCSRGVSAKRQLGAAKGAHLRRARPATIGEIRGAAANL
jgi:hypothetical protein